MEHPDDIQLLEALSEIKRLDSQYTIRLGRFLKTKTFEKKRDRRKFIYDWIMEDYENLYEDYLRDRMFEAADIERKMF